MKKHKILPLLMAAVFATVSIPVQSLASDTTKEETSSDVTFQDVTGDTQDTVSTEEEVTEEGDSLEEEAADKVPEADASTSEVIEGANIETDNVVTLGENLTKEQREAMYSYFGTSADKVRTIIVTHADEVKYMEGIATAAQIGNTTNSCAYVEPTSSGGIKVKTANLNYVTSAMIASTLTTAGMENANVIAACPFEVSGTGALTGIIMAYELASGDTLDADKKEAAMEELITTGNLADTIGSETAQEVMNEVKTEILDKGLTEPEEIREAVEDIAENHGATLTEEQMQQVIDLMEKISKFDYDLDAIKSTLDSLSGKVGAIEGFFTSVKNFFVGSADGILSETNDAALGGDVLTDSTVDLNEMKEGIITKIINFFKK